MLGKLDIPNLKLTPAYVNDGKKGKPIAVQLPIEQYEEIAHTLKQLKRIKQKLAKAEQELATSAPVKRLSDGLRQAAMEVKAFDEGKLQLQTLDEFLKEVKGEQ